MSPPDLPTQRELFEWKRQLVKQSRAYFNKLPENQKEALRVYKYMGYQVINQFLRNLAQIRQGTPKTSPFGKFKLDINTSIITRKLFDEYQKVRAKITNKTTLGQLTEIIQKFHYDAYQTIIVDMDKCFAAKSRIPKLTNPQPSKKTILYRGSMLPTKLVNKRVGDILEFGEYLSTTLEPEIAFRFLHLGGASDASSKPVLLIIHGYDGKPFIFLDWDAVETHQMDKLKFTHGSDEYELVLPRGCKFKIVKKYRSDEYTKYYKSEAVALQKLSNFYSDIGNIESNFFSRESVKDVINGKIELTVIEVEFVKQLDKKITHINANDPGVLTEIDFFLGDIVPKPNKHKTIKSVRIVGTGKRQTLKTNTKHAKINTNVGNK